MSDVKVMLWLGGDAPNRDAKLTVSAHHYGYFQAYWEPGFCGCEDCHPIVGYGETPAEAEVNYWEQWEEKTNVA